MRVTTTRKRSVRSFSMGKKGVSGTVRKGPQQPPMTGKAMPSPAAGSKVKAGVEPGGLPFRQGGGAKRKPGT